MFLPYGAVDGRLVLCFESSDRDGPMVDSRISVKYIYTINEQIQNIAQKKDTLCRMMYN